MRTPPFGATDTDLFFLPGYKIYTKKYKKVVDKRERD
jgi:hypothetical protein